MEGGGGHNDNFRGQSGGEGRQYGHMCALRGQKPGGQFVTVEHIKRVEWLKRGLEGAWGGRGRDGEGKASDATCVSVPTIRYTVLYTHTHTLNLT